MSSSYPGRVSATQVGSYFVGQYYLVLQQQPDRVHQFYTEGSTMIRVDGDSSESASAMLEIHTLLISLNFTAIEIKTINSLDSWNGGVLVMVSGLVKTRDFSGRRNFVQSFFLAPQEKGYFVLNDIFQFVDDGRIYQHQAPIPLEGNFDAQPNPSNTLPEPPVSDYVEEAQDYVSSIHIEDDLVDKYSLPEQQEQEDYETEIVVEETPVEEPSPSFQSMANTVHEAPAPAVEEPVGEAPKKTYASILRVSKGQTASSVASQSSLHKSSPAVSDWNHTPLPAAQQSNFVPSFLPEAGVDAVEEGLTVEEEEGEPKSVYVRNLPSNVTEAEIEEEFKNFGQIIPDGIFIRLRKEIGLCYAFVEFEDLMGVQNALKASPIQLAGRQVYIEERRPNSSSAYRGGNLNVSSPILWSVNIYVKYVDQEGVEEEEVTKQRPQRGVLVLGAWAGEAIRIVVNTTD
ncbi:nuclear transport factor 2 isoform X2 [Juglans microcarpa x Juglans regia]|uniref:nuclear transport factor 2 isoform X2 n=1 Tax=Juglans microcarpa x Juglans regia TaxID=2249226 RepID=UPI001B7F406E|nr:nuclear transport factor 2 isoform X2 [Juglans microcarpa x Juglans regia]